MATEAYYVDLSVRVRIDIDEDTDVIERVTGPGGDEWRAQLYNLHTEDDVLSHLGYNCVANGAQNASLLDGWADLPKDAVQMRVTGCEFVEWVNTTPEKEGESR